jgi:hypothetical protein
MNTETLDREEYRDWWKSEGWDDLTTCPCGQPAGDVWPKFAGIIVRPAPENVSGYSYCPRHRYLDITREGFAEAILDGTFGEADLTELDARRAKRVADGGGPFDA